MMDIAYNDSILSAQLAIRDAALILSYIFVNFIEVGNSPLCLDFFFIEKICIFKYF
jgi:hypothetical protein